MTFIQLIRREMHGSLPRLVVMSSLGGLSTAAILASLNSVAQNLSKDTDKPSLWAAGLFLVALVLFINTQHYTFITSTVEIESIIHKVRLRLLDEVRRSELAAIEGIGRARIVA